MAIPTTLLAYRTGRRQQFETESKKAQDRLRDIQLTLLPAARKASDDLAAQSADLGKQTAVLRVSIAQAATAADAEVVIKKLETASIGLRAADANQAEAQRQIDTLMNDQTSQSAAISALTQGLAAAQADEKAATDRLGRIQDADTAVTSAPLKDIKAAAAAALSGVTAAATGITADIPAALLTRALDRRQAVVDRLKHSATATSAAEALAASKSKQATSKAEDSLFAYIAQAQSRLDAAVAIVTDPGTAPLTAEEKACLTETTLLTDGTKAIGAEKKRDDAQQLLDNKQVALDDAVLQARNTDIDVDLTTVQAVTDATKERDDALADLKTKNANFTDAMRADLHRWEAALPEANWSLVDHLEEARATLTELSTLDPSTLKPAIDAAEATWVAALYASDKKTRTAQWIDAQVQSRSSAQEFENNINRHRRLTALRGDL